jgi:DNA-binding NarL/FixJ family response regulator
LVYYLVSDVTADYNSHDGLRGVVEAKIRVAVLCCNRLLRSIARILSKKTEFEVTTTHEVNGTAVSEDATTVLVLDSIQAMASVGIPSERRAGRSARCVLIAMDDDADQFLAALRHGALGYILQDASAADVVSAVRQVAQDEAVCAPHLTRILFDYVASRRCEHAVTRRSSRLDLTRREQQLVPLISRGLTNKEIASHFGLSEQTVKNHVHRILRKVGVRDRLSVLDAYENPRLSTNSHGTFPGTVRDSGF